MHTANPGWFSPPINGPLSILRNDPCTQNQYSRTWFPPHLTPAKSKANPNPNLQQDTPMSFGKPVAFLRGSQEPRLQGAAPPTQEPLSLKLGGEVCRS